jgi:hypothetical protein
MRPLTRNERILLPVLGLILFGGANFFGYQWLAKRQTALHLELLEARADRAVAEVDLAQVDLWQQRRAWLDQHQPALGDEGDARAQMLETVLKGARDQHLDVLEQNLDEVEHNAGGTVVRVGVKVKGPMEGLCRWLAALQKPSDFYAVRAFSLKADEDATSMVCTLEVVRFFKPEPSS